MSRLRRAACPPDRRWSTRRLEPTSDLTAARAALVGLDAAPTTEQAAGSATAIVAFVDDYPDRRAPPRAAGSRATSPRRRSCSTPRVERVAAHPAPEARSLAPARRSRATAMRTWPAVALKRGLRRRAASRASRSTRSRSTWTCTRHPRAAERARAPAPRHPVPGARSGGRDRPDQLRVPRPALVRAPGARLDRDRRVRPAALPQGVRRGPSASLSGVPGPGERIPGRAVSIKTGRRDADSRLNPVRTQRSCPFPNSISSSNSSPTRTPRPGRAHHHAGASEVAPGPDDARWRPRTWPAASTARRSSSSTSRSSAASGRTASSRSSRGSSRSSRARSTESLGPRCRRTRTARASCTAARRARATESPPASRSSPTSSRPTCACRTTCGWRGARRARHHPRGAHRRRAQDPARDRLRIGEVLVQMGVTTWDQVQEAITRQNSLRQKT